METSRTELPSLEDPKAVKLSRLLQRYSGLDDLKEIQKVFESGVDVNVILDEDFNRPLHLACIGFDKPDHARYDLVRYLIERGADLNVRNGEKISKSCFYSVCSTWSFELIKLAVEHGANDKGQDDSIIFALIDTYYSDSRSFYIIDKIEDMIEFLVQHGASVNSLEALHHNSPLISLCSLSDYCCPDYLKFLTVLLENGADVNYRNDKQQIALSEYLLYPSHELDVVYFDGLKLLFDNLDDQSSFFNHVCHYGYINFNHKIIDFMVKYGVNVNAYDDHLQDSPLIYAARSRNVDRMTALLHHGADVNHRNEDGQSALSEYLSYSLYEDDDRLFEGVKLLVEAGTDLKAKCYLNQACKYVVDLKVIQYLIDSGAPVNDMKSEDTLLTPLHEACYKGNLDLIKLLVENGANVNAHTLHTLDNKPLKITKILKFDEASEYLIKMGATYF